MMRLRPRYAFLAGGLLVVVLAIGFSSVRFAAGEPSRSQAARDAGGARTTAKKSAPQTTAIMTSVIAKALAPQYVKGSDGKVHIEYDLLSTNIMPIPVTLTGLEVRAGNGRRLLALEGDALEAATRQIIGATTREVPGSGALATVVDIEMAPGEVPERLTNRITYKFAPGTPESAHTAIGSLRTEGPKLQVPRRPATVIAPPLSGKGWWSGNGCCVPGDAHRFLRIAVDGVRYDKPETFAIDWLRIRDGEFLKGDELENASYFAYGARVRSATGGRVVSVRNNMPDETPDFSGAPLPSVKGPEDYAGNHVVVRMRPGVYALYAHLQPGSVAVRVGDEVEPGQFLGTLGNSGNTTFPHLHFGLATGPDPLTSDSLPFVIDRYRLVGTADTSDLASLKVPPIKGPPRDERRTHPLSSSVADFR